MWVNKICLFNERKNLKRERKLFKANSNIIITISSTNSEYIHDLRLLLFLLFFFSNALLNPSYKELQINH